MLHFTGHLQRSKQKCRTLINMAYSLHNVIMRAIIMNIIYPVCICEASVTHFPCVLKSVIITVESLT